jgi:hypothetical protein
MQKLRSYTQTFLALMVFVGIGSWWGPQKIIPLAESSQLTSTTTKYVWWMLKWSDHQLLCNFETNYEGMPSMEDIRYYCGNDLATAWLTTPACNSTAGCAGVYLHLANTETVNTQTTLGSSNSLAFQEEQKEFVDSCARIWQSQPPPYYPNWLSTPQTADELATSNDYLFLAGRLIDNGVVDARNCPSGGLESNGYANQCGMEASRTQVIYWQNQFDPMILLSAYEIGIPATLMKNLFARESQFWPGTFLYPREYGLGQITNQGIDTLFLWSPTFYNEFCPKIFRAETCSKPYIRLSEETKALLRGAVIARIAADCPECPTGVDLEKTEQSIPVFTEAVQANCVQVGQIVTYVTGYVPGAVVTYQDLWRLTIANYHAGSGNVAFAIYKTWDQTKALAWDDIIYRFPKEVRYIVKYVGDIAQ